MLYIFSKDSEGFPMVFDGKYLAENNFPPIFRYLVPAPTENVWFDDAYVLWHKLVPDDIVITREGRFLVKQGTPRPFINEGVEEFVPTLCLEQISNDPGYSYCDVDKGFKWFHTVDPITDWITGS